MPRYISVSLCALLTAVLLGSGPASATAQSFKWWHEEKFQSELDLSTEQVARIEELFQSASPAMRAGKEALDTLQKELSEMVKSGRADEATAAALIAEVEAARGELGKTRALMLYRMRRLLTSDQHTKLQVLFAEHQRSRRGRKPSPGE